MMEAAESSSVSPVFYEIPDPRAWALGLAQLAVYGITLLLNLLAVGLCVSNRALFKCTPIKFALSPMVTEIIKNTVTCTFLAIFLSDGGSLRSIGPAGCDAYALALLVGFIVGGLSLTNIAVERYLVVTGRHPSDRYLLASNVALFLVGTIMALAYRFAGSGFEVSSAQVYCFVKWHSRHRGDMAVNIAGTTFISAGLVAGLVLRRRVRTLHNEAQRAMSLALQTEMKSVARKQTDESRESRYLPIRFYGFSLAGGIGWTPYTAKALYEMISGVKASFEVDAIATTFMALSGLALILVHVLFTPLLRSEVRVFWDRIRSWATTTPSRRLPISPNEGISGSDVFVSRANLGKPLQASKAAVATGSG